MYLNSLACGYDLLMSFATKVKLYLGTARCWSWWSWWSWWSIFCVGEYGRPYVLFVRLVRLGERRTITLWNPNEVNQSNTKQTLALISALVPGDSSPGFWLISLVCFCWFRGNNTEPQYFKMLPIVRAAVRNQVGTRLCKQIKYNPLTHVNGTKSYNT